MNICFLIGKIISEVDFKFIINNKKYISIAIFKLKVNESCIVTIKAYNELADYCYSKLIKNDKISVLGNIDSDGKVEITDIESYE